MNTPVVRVLPEVLLRGFFLGMASGFFSCSASLGSTVDTCIASVTVFVIFYGPLFLAVSCSVCCLRSTCFGSSGR